MWGNANCTYYCPACDHTARAQYGAACPLCRQSMLNMGKDWRPGKKGSKERLWNRRQVIHRLDARRLTASRKRMVYTNGPWDSKGPSYDDSALTGAWVRRYIKTHEQRG